MSDIGYLNGRFSPLDEIRISPDDRGFLFGDGIYEVIRAYHGVPAFGVSILTGWLGVLKKSGSTFL